MSYQPDSLKLGLFRNVLANDLATPEIYIHTCISYPE